MNNTFHSLADVLLNDFITRSWKREKPLENSKKGVHQTLDGLIKVENAMQTLNVSDIKKNVCPH